MQLSSGMSEESIHESLQAAALETWGPERLEVLRGSLRDTARTVWLLLQEPLTSLEEEPDFPPRARQRGTEA